MSYLDLSIKEIHEAILKGLVSPKELVLESIKRAKEDTNNAFEYICEKEALKEVEELSIELKDSPLYGIPYVLKDNFSTKDVPTCASSDILKGYVPVFSSEVALRLKKAGAILIGKTTLDELAMGGSGLSGHKGPTYNPWDPTHTHQVGGSSCGSAATVAAGIVPLGIGSDTGDSARKPASYAGLVGFKPSWGRISRFGLFSFAPSLDHVGYFTRSVEDSALVLQALAGRDDKDSTSSFEPVENYSFRINDDVRGKRFVIVKEIYDSISNKTIRDSFEKVVDKLKAQGAVIEEVSLDIKLCKAIYPTYIIISSSESTSNNANLDGIKFGPRYEGKNLDEIIRKTRTYGLGLLAKKRFMIGGYSLLKENQEDTFIRAQKCRHLIVDKINELFKNYDCIIMPSAPSVAHLINDDSSDKLSLEYLLADNYLAYANFGGYPSISIPLGMEEGLPFGVNLTCPIYLESELFNLAKNIENITGLAGILANRR